MADQAQLQTAETGAQRLAKHTPGPWETGFHFGQRTLVLAKQRYPICNTLTAPWGETNVWREEANARLIAAAPELLEALRACEKWIVDLAESGDAGFWDASEAPEVIAARAAIAKAEAA
jgi:hypothetical protein